MINFKFYGLLQHYYLIFYSLIRLDHVIITIKGSLILKQCWFHLHVSWGKSENEDFDVELKLGFTVIS